MPVKTKRDLERQIAELQAQVKAMRNELEILNPRNGCVRYIPCGPITDVNGHAFEQEIRDAVCDSYDGATGWLIIEFWKGEFPFSQLLCNVSYTEECGTYVDKFCLVGKQRLKTNYDTGESTWMTEEEYINAG